MTNTYRLSSKNLFHRPKEETKKPKRLIVLSVEGDKTEPSYFKNCNILLDDAIVQIEVLTRKEGDSAIAHIYETLTEYIKLERPLNAQKIGKTMANRGLFAIVFPLVCAFNGRSNVL